MRPQTTVFQRMRHAYHSNEHPIRAIYSVNAAWFEIFVKPASVELLQYTISVCNPNNKRPPFVSVLYKPRGLYSNAPKFPRASLYQL